MNRRSNRRSVPSFFIRKEKIKRRKIRNKRVMLNRLFVVLILCLIVISVIGVVKHLNNNLAKDETKDTPVTENNKTDLDYDNYENPPAEDASLESKLVFLAKKDSRLDRIIENIDRYPENVLELLVRNPETTDFALGYFDEKISPDKIKLYEKKGKIPLFLQWDKRWGYNEYNESIIALGGCGPTCLSMIIVGLTGNTDANPYAVSVFSEENGYAVPGNGTAWTLFSAGSKSFNITPKELPLMENSMVNELQSGHPIVCALGPGDFTEVGHFIVIYDYTDGEFLVNDPNSVERSNKKWSYDSIKDQISNIWSFSV